MKMMGCRQVPHFFVRAPAMRGRAILSNPQQQAAAGFPLLSLRDIQPWRKTSVRRYDFTVCRHTVLCLCGW